MKNAAALQGAIVRLIGLIGVAKFSLGSIELYNLKAWSSLGVVDLGFG